MTGMGRRVDDVHDAVTAPQDVAVPQVAVQACRVLGGDEVGEPADDLLDHRAVLRTDRTAVAGDLEIGEHPLGGKELGPARRGGVAHRQAPDVAVVLEAELLGALPLDLAGVGPGRSEEHTYELPSIMRIPFA